LTVAETGGKSQGLSGRGSKCGLQTLCIAVLVDRDSCSILRKDSGRALQLNLRRGMQKREFRILLGLGLLLTVAVYELPFALTLAKVGWSALPPVVDYPADQMLYLNLAAVRHASATEIINPWYGDRVPIVDVPHLHFGVTFRLLDAARWVFRSWTATILVWNGVWSTLTYGAAVFCLLALAPELDAIWALIFGFGLVVLLSPLTYISALRGLPHWHGFFELTLPYVRFAFPQVVLPALLAYWGFLAKWLRKGSWRDVLWMGLLQFAACAAFPYVVPLMAAATLFAVLIVKIGDRIAVSWSQVAALGGLSVVLDLGYLLLSGLGHSHGNVRMSPEFHANLILPSLRPYVVLLIAMAGLAMMARVSLAARATAAGAALASALLGFSDVFLPKESQMLVHVNYVNALPTLLALFLFAWPFVKERSTRLAIVVLTALFLVSLWEGYANYHNSRGIYQLQRAALHEMAKITLSPHDLVLAPAEMSDDISCWVPLVSAARVLYTPDAENMLPADRIRGEHALRQALYLQMRGMNDQRLSALTTSGSGRLPGALPLFSEREYLSSPLTADRAYGHSLVRDRLLPILQGLEINPARAEPVFSGMQRVVVIEDSSRPIFVKAALEKWMEIVEDKNEDGVRVLIGKPRALDGELVRNHSTISGTDTR
jgi:hypothetical protein